MYLGEGMVLQAPRTGETVRVSPVATYPILGAVRPDQRPDQASAATDAR
jgi:peptidoglycan DL-endopeptidase CwlO